jgi:hypothetical protein
MVRKARVSKNKKVMNQIYPLKFSTLFTPDIDIPNAMRKLTEIFIAVLHCDCFMKRSLTECVNIECKVKFVKSFSAVGCILMNTVAGSSM